MLTKAKNIARPFVHWVQRSYEKAGGRRRCCICSQSLRRFRPFRQGWQSFSPFFLALKPIGSDVENFMCPLCGCFDRERHLVMYFDHLGLWEKMTKARILHFAPEGHLSARIAQQQPHTYIKAGISPAKPDVHKIDVTQIPFEDNFFDMVICNHVLEHVAADEQALAELFRVLRPGGFAILQTPYSGLLKNTFCDPAINTDDLRNRFYGQEDHVRLYGRDLFQKIAASGFQLHLKAHASVLSDKDPRVFGVNPEEDLILATKAL